MENENPVCLVGGVQLLYLGKIASDGHCLSQTVMLAYLLFFVLPEKTVNDW